MRKLLAAIRLVPFTQLLLLIIAILLYLNLQEQRITNERLNGIDNDVAHYLWQIEQDMPSNGTLQ